MLLCFIRVFLLIDPLKTNQHYLSSNTHSAVTVKLFSMLKAPDKSLRLIHFVKIFIAIHWNNISQYYVFVVFLIKWMHKISLKNTIKNTPNPRLLNRTVLSLSHAQHQTFRSAHLLLQVMHKLLQVMHEANTNLLER